MQLNLSLSSKGFNITLLPWRLGCLWSLGFQGSLRCLLIVLDYSKAPLSSGYQGLGKNVMFFKFL